MIYFNIVIPSLYRDKIVDHLTFNIEVNCINDLINAKSISDFHNFYIERDENYKQICSTDYVMSNLKANSRDISLASRIIDVPNNYLKVENVTYNLDTADYNNIHVYIELRYNTKLGIFNYCYATHKSIINNLNIDLSITFEQIISVLNKIVISKLDDVNMYSYIKNDYIQSHIYFFNHSDKSAILSFSYNIKDDFINYTVKDINLTLSQNLSSMSEDYIFSTLADNLYNISIDDFIINISNINYHYSLSAEYTFFDSLLDKNYTIRIDNIKALSKEHCKIKANQLISLICNEYKRIIIN